MVKKYVCIPRSFLVINVCNQGRLYARPVLPTRYSNMPHVNKIHGNNPDFLRGSNDLKESVATTVIRLKATRFVFVGLP